MRKVRYAASGAAPIAPDILKFFMGIGVPMHEVYGMTENTAIATANRPGRVKLGTVGEAHDEVEIRIDEDTGEIQTRHAGQLRRLLAQRARGDGGDVHRGRLAADRRRRRVGRRHPPQDHRPHEGHHHHRGRQEHLAVGDRERPEGLPLHQGGRRHRRPAQVPDRAHRHRARHRRRLGAAPALPYTTYRDLTEKEEVQKLVEEIVDETNAKFASVEQIKKFRLLPKELDHEEGELTATQKVKRSALIDQFSELVESMYGGKQ
jgi:long-chain acyl-CoA synthetase